MALNKNKLRRGDVPPVVKYYFEISGSAEPVVYKCIKCGDKPTNKWKTGYTNLYRHLQRCQGDDFRARHAAVLKTKKNNLGFEVEEYVSERDFVTFKWLKWVVMRDMAFSEVDDELTRELAGLSSSAHVCSKSIKTYIHQLLPLVELVIKKIFPEHFAIMFDGWQDNSTHYIAVFAVFQRDNKANEMLIGFSPPLDEQSYTAESHRDLVMFMLSVFDRSLSNISVLIGDNCSTNKKTADLIDVPLLGCAAHKLNLAIKRYVKEQPGAELRLIV